MGLNTHRILETSLFDLEQIVTVQYLSRRADLSIDDAKNELVEFLTQNKNRTELHAIYLLSGELKILGAIGSNNIGDASITRKHRTQLVRDSDLEETQKAYRKVETCEIYCLHTKPIKSLCLLYSADSLEDAEFERSDLRRSWLSYPETETKTKEMLAHYGTIPTPLTQKNRAQAGSVLSATEFPEPKTKKRKDNVTSIFVQTTKQIKQEETPSIDNVSQKGQGNVVKKSNIMTRRAIKCRRQRALIGSKEEGVREETESSEIVGVKNVVTRLLEETTSSNKDVPFEMRNTFLTQDDLFSDGNSNSDKMDNDEIRTIETAEKERIAEKLPQFFYVLNTAGNDRLKNESSYGIQKRETRKEYVTETFLDNDGFMVTKQLLKEIKVEPSSAHESTEERNKTRNVKPSDSRERRSAKVPQRQAKINSFFQRK